MNNENKVVGINGFGRFGLHLLKYWLDRSTECKFQIKYINDDVISIDQAVEMISHDKAVIFNKYKIQLIGSVIVFSEPDGSEYEIQYTNSKKSDIPWLEKPNLLFECSGKNTTHKDCIPYLRGNVKVVLISATSWDPDKTLVYGFNHDSFSAKEDKIVSYGSCTVNAYVPFASYLNEKYCVLDSDVNVIHNIQEYRLDDNNTLNRKFCTLEKSAPNLVNFVNSDNFIVNYTVIPYTGVSMIDFRFKLKKQSNIEDIISDLEYSFSQGKLKGLYAFDETDIGPEVYNCTTYSVVFIKEQVKLVNENLYLFGYFDNENSVNRFFDLADYISSIEE